MTYLKTVFWGQELLFPGEQILSRWPLITVEKYVYDNDYHEDYWSSPNRFVFTNLQNQFTNFQNQFTNFQNELTNPV